MTDSLAGLLWDRVFSERASCSNFPCSSMFQGSVGCDWIDLMCHSRWGCPFRRRVPGRLNGKLLCKDSENLTNPRPQKESVVWTWDTNLFTFWTHHLKLVWIEGKTGFRSICVDTFCRPPLKRKEKDVAWTLMYLPNFDCWWFLDGKFVVLVLSLFKILKVPPASFDLQLLFTQSLGMLQATRHNKWRLGSKLDASKLFLLW